jgi:hypothetical protein
MRRPFIFLSLTAIVFLSAFILLWDRNTFPPKSTGLEAQMPVNIPSVVSSKPASIEPRRSWENNTYVQMPADRKPGFDPSLPQWQEWKRRKEVDGNWEWKMPINFWGQVLDQNNQPVSGAMIRYGWNDMKGSNERFDESNSLGKFSLSKIQGKILSVRVSKEGYHAVGNGRGSYEYSAFFEWNYHEPNENNPVVFRLIKKLEAEPLIAREVFSKLSYEDGSYYYDLKSGKIGRRPPEDAGLKFTFIRSATKQGQPFDWSWKTEGVNAAIQATSDEFAQMAPPSGYAKQWEASETADAEKFQQNGNVRLYIQTTDNRYAVVDLELRQPNLRDLGPSLGVKSFLNPKAGSRNLEYDPEKKWPTP